jgi:hypothetical protein
MTSFTHEQIEQLLVAANRVREKQASLTEAIEILTAVSSLSSDADYWHGSVHSQAGLANCYRLLFQETHDPQFQKLMETHARQALALVEPPPSPVTDEINTAYETMAQMFATNYDWPQSLVWWEKLLAVNSVRDAYYGRILEHLAQAQWQSGQTDLAETTVNQAVSTIKQNDERSISPDHDYRWRVWLTGALMKQLFILTKLNKPQEAQQVMSELESQLSDPRLSHRQRQYLDLKKELNL